MAALSTAPNATTSTPHSQNIASALRGVVEAAVSYLTAKVSAKAGDVVEDAVEGMDDLAATGGAAEQAGYEGVKADLLGKNPIWAALKGAWSGASVKLRLVVVLVLVLVLLLAPVVLVLLILGLLVAAIVAGIRAATR